MRYETRDENRIQLKQANEQLNRVEFEFADHYQNIYNYYTQSADRTVSSFVDSSAQHRGNEAEPDSNGNKNFQSGPNVPCQSARTDKSVSSA